MKFKSKNLNDILKSELALGNEVVEVTAWPPKCKKLIFLKLRFHHDYEDSSLIYDKLDDPHYWYAEYATTNHEECLACRW